MPLIRWMAMVLRELGQVIAAWWYCEGNLAGLLVAWGEVASGWVQVGQIGDEVELELTWPLPPGGGL